MSILVTGGAGYIGSHTCVALIQAGYDILIADNFSNSCETVIQRLEQIVGKTVPYERIELCDAAQADDLFVRHPEIEAVIHFAGLKSVPESITQPLTYYETNLVSTMTLLQVMQEYGVHKLVFSSSASVYGDKTPSPVCEDAPVGDTKSPSAATKVMQERMISDIAAASDLSAVILRYFNPVGAHESALIGEDPHGTPSNLVPYIALVAAGKRQKLRIYGADYATKDGTGVRDYIHIMDLAQGHVAALKKLEHDTGCFIYNLGTGNGFSVLDAVHAYEKACGKISPYEVVARREGDIEISYADPSKAAMELGWCAQYDLDDICRSSWKWQQANPNGYQK